MISGTGTSGAGRATRVRRRLLATAELGSANWTEGTWAAALHAASWAAFTAGRLHSQLLAVVALTASRVRANSGARAAELRSAPPRPARGHGRCTAG